MRRRARDVALRMLEHLFAREPFTSEPPADSLGRTFDLADFQREGADRVRAVLARRHGAVLADSVGLGKTYIALALIEEVLAAGGDAVVVVPAAVRSLWRRELRRLPVVGAGWRLLSHTQLARGAVVRPPPDEPLRGRSAARRLVVVDEAHRFRNPRTNRYGALARLVAPGVRTLLITATPINNQPDDLLHLLRLFAADDAFVDVGVPGLRDAFESSTASDDGRVAAVVRAVVVRRTRAMIRDRFDGRLTGPTDARAPRFPRRAPPQLVRYSDPLLPGAVRGLTELELAPYVLGYRSGATSGAASGLIRLNLLKRLDSSGTAFAMSLRRLERLLRLGLDATRAGRILGPVIRGPRGRADDLDPLQLTLVELIAAPAPLHVDLESLARSLERDLERVRALIAHHRRDPDADPKALALRALLHASHGERIVVFTEYRDTAEALWRGLAGRFRTGRVDGSGAWLGRQPAGRRTVVESFAPRSNGRRHPLERERVDVLIATDVLAEGVNLQDARYVVSYDLPWNPVRLLQRIGRVDRLGSSHDTVTPYLFLPAEGLEEMLGLTRRIRTKLGHITRTVGAEEGDALLERLGAQPTSAAPADHDIDRLLREVEDAREDPLETLRTLWIRDGREHGNRREHPHRRERSGVADYAATLAVPHDHPAAALRWIVLLESAGAPALLEVRQDGAVGEIGSAGIAALTLAIRGVPKSSPTASESTIPAPADNGDGLPLRAIRRYLRRSLQHADTPSPLPRNDPGRRLAGRIRATMARAGAALDSTALERADSLLARLSTPLTPGTGARVAALLDAQDQLRGHAPPPGDPVDAATAVAAALAGAEAALGPGVAQRTTSTPRRPQLLVIATLRTALNAPPEAVDGPLDEG